MFFATEITALIHKQVRLPPFVNRADKIPDKHDMVGANRLAQQIQLRFVRQPVPFLIITADACAHEVFP